MSVFKDSAIVLKIQKLDEKKLLYQVFSRDFWKISVTKNYSKKEKNIDLGNLVNFEIVTKETANIHRIKNVKIISSFNTQQKSFSLLNSYLEVLYKVHKEFQAGVANREIFELLSSLNQNEKLREVDLLLATLKIDSIEWVLQNNHNNPQIQKILSFIQRENFRTIMKLWGFTESVINELKQIKTTI